MGAFPDAWMNELLSKNDIVSVVSDYAVLNRKGGRYWACCPFHSEKTPSFSVTQDKQFYYCFGCHKGGSVVNFIMEIEHLNYVEAITMLAQRVNMELPGEVNDEEVRRERQKRERQYAACRDAARFFHKQLMSNAGEAAREYLLRRKLTSQTVARFGIGYAPDSWTELCDYLTGLGYSTDELIMAGLVRKKTADSGNARCFDAFRGRVMFPIISVSDRVIGFGARAMGNEQPKYLNTGETAVFNKRYNLYALNMVKKQKSDDIIIVEGYMDVIGLYMRGVNNAVASLGTALTREQARLLKRYTGKVYVAYDGDSAGQNATLRGLDILAHEGINVRVIVIPDNMDPDEYSDRFGGEAFHALKDEAMSLNEFKLDFIRRGSDLSGADGREEYAKRACALVKGFQPVEKERYYPIISRNAGVSLEAVKLQCTADKSASTNNIDRLRNNNKKLSYVPEIDSGPMQMLMCCVLNEPSAARLIRDTCMELMPSEQIRDFVTMAAEYADKGKKTEPSLLMAELEPEISRQLAEAMQQSESITNPMHVARDCIMRLRIKALEHEKRSLSIAIDSGSEDASTLLKQIQSIDSQIRELKSQIQL